MSAADVASPTPLALRLPAEPEGVRRLLRAALLDGAEWEEQFGPELGLGEVLWPAWEEALSSGGLDREQFGSVLRGYRREVWFWVLGDRIWAQMVTGLAGRLARRLPPV